jgi:hypothetical protein
MSGQVWVLDEEKQDGLGFVVEYANERMWMEMYVNEYYQDSLRLDGEKGNCRLIPLEGPEALFQGWEWVERQVERRKRG